MENLNEDKTFKLKFSKPLDILIIFLRKTKSIFTLLKNINPLQVTQSNSFINFNDNSKFT